MSEIGSLSETSQDESVPAGKGVDGPPSPPKDSADELYDVGESVCHAYAGDEERESSSYGGDEVEKLDERDRRRTSPELGEDESVPPPEEGVLPPEMRMEGGEGMYMDAAPHLGVSSKCELAGTGLLTEGPYRMPLPDIRPRG
jgi:hypothetical protein